MNRVDLLTAKLLDETLTDEEWAELEGLLAADARAEESHYSLLELEGVLRGLRTEFDLAARTIERVKEAQADKTTRAVMAEIAMQSPPTWSDRKSEPAAARSRRRSWFVAAAVVAVAAGLVLALWLGTREDETRPVDTNPAPVFARLTHTSGSVELLSPTGDAQPAHEGCELPFGHTLRTVGEESMARVELPDRTTVEIEPDSIVRFVGANGGERNSHLFLASGQVTAELPEDLRERQLVIGTSAAEVFAQSGMFVVSSAGPESVRVDIKRGTADVVGLRLPKPVSVAKGSAVMRAGFERVFLEPALRVDRAAARTLKQQNSRDAIFSPDGKEVWVVSPRQFTRWTRDGGTAESVFPPRKGGYGPVAFFTRDRSMLVTTAARSKDDKTNRDDHLYFRSLPGGEELRSIDLKLPEPRFWTVAPRAEWLALVGPRPNMKHVRVLDGATGAERWARDFEANVTCLLPSPDGRVLALGLTEPGRGGNNKVILVDAVTGERISSVPTQRRGASALAFSNDGRLLAVGFHGLVQVWDVKSRELVRTITGFERVVTCLSFSPAGNVLAAGTQDGQVWLWAVATGRPIQLIEVGGRGVRTVSFSPDGQRLVAVANNAPVGLWRVAEIPPDSAAID